MAQRAKENRAGGGPAGTEDGLTASGTPWEKALAHIDFNFQRGTAADKVCTILRVQELACASALLCAVAAAAHCLVGQRSCRDESGHLRLALWLPTSSMCCLQARFKNVLFAAKVNKTAAA